MNYLAHCFLSGASPEIIVGNFITDAASLKWIAKLPEPIQRGVEIHRFIDSYTDQHPSVKSVVSLLRARHGKYAPVVSDLLWDHVLAREWKKYSKIDLQVYAASCYTIFENYFEYLPPRLSNSLDKMIDDNFLYRYYEIEGLKRSLAYMDKRTSFHSRFQDAIIDLEEYNREIFDAFNSFFPEIIVEVNQLLN